MNVKTIRRASAGAAILAAVACTHAPGDDSTNNAAPAIVSQEIVSATPGWNGWSSLGGGLTTDPALVSYDVNHVAAFATNQDLWVNWFEALAWKGWVNLGNNGNALTAPPVAVVAGNHIEVFVQDTTSGFLLHKEGTFNGGSAPTWSGWENIWLLENAPGGSLANAGHLANLGRPPAVVVTQPNNQVNVFANFADGTTKAIKVYGFGNWSFWTNLGGVSHYEPGAASWGSNRLDVFVVGTDSQVYHQYSDDEGTTFYPSGNNWELVGGNAASSPSVVSWGANRLDVFVSGRPAEQITGVQHLAWTGSSWGTCGSPPCWDSLHLLAWQDGTGGPMSPPVAVTTGVGAINVFVQSIDEGLETIGMTAANPPTWGLAQELTNCFRTFGAPAVISPDGNTLDVAVTAYAANGDASVYAESSVGGTDFMAGGTANLPACSCGFPGGPCCWPNNGCNANASCGSNVVCGCNSGTVQETVNGQPACVPSGGVGEPCNANGTCNAGQIICQSGTCVATGGTGEPCNSNGTCNSGNLCSGGKCEACGANGDVCCGSNACNSGLSCQSGKCAPCGTSGEVCCGGNACNSGLACEGGKCATPPCGASGESCCSGSKCNSGLACESGKCAAPPTCGQSGQTCCDNSLCNSITLTCDPTTDKCCTPTAYDVCVTCDGTSLEDVYPVEACSAQAAVEIENGTLANEGSGCGAVSASTVDGYCTANGN